MMEKRNVVEEKRTPAAELADPDDTLVKSAAIEFDIKPAAARDVEHTAGGTYDSSE